MYELWVVVVIAALSCVLGFIVSKGIKYTRQYWQELRRNKGEKLIEKYNDRALISSIITSAVATLFGLDLEENLEGSDYFTSEHLDKNGYLTYVVMTSPTTSEMIAILVNLKRNKLCMQYEAPLNDDATDTLKWNKTFSLNNDNNSMGFESIVWIQECRQQLIGELTTDGE
jgi:hypothetical protein